MRRFASNDIHALIYLHRITGNNFGGDFFGKLAGNFGLSYGGRTDKKDDFVFML